MTLFLSAIGVLTIYSAINAGTNFPAGVLHVKQMIWFGIGFGVLLFCTFLEYRTLACWATPIYRACIFWLVSVLLFGTYGGGSRRWLGFGPVSLQPSELTKIAIIVVLARYYSKNVTSDGLTLRELATPFLYTAIPFVLIVRQPDLGTAGLIVLIAASITFFVKIEKKTFISLASTGAVLFPVIWFFLKDYQKRRILTFLNPDRDPLGAGYHIIQSKIAIGSGKLFGKGLLKGTQNSLSFLPEQHTDFIFSVLAEEWGFAGSFLVIVLFLLLIAKGLDIAYNCRDPFGIILSIGATSLIFWQAFINIGMVMGLMPIVGVPLPLISYGGSSMLTMMISIGILLNISMRRFMKE